MERVILHCDLNNFYASVECLYHPPLRSKAVAIAGDPQARHGIVLAKNDIAKRFGVATGDPLWLARQKCPEIVFVPPHYERYLQYSRLAREIYQEYTDLVEPYGLDECWLDVTDSVRLFGDGAGIAGRLRERIRCELGVTASVGVSFNKIFAKLGSDLKKPDATTVIPRECFREIVWPLPVSDLLCVGRSTAEKLKRHCIYTIGGLAGASPDFLSRLLGKNGIRLWQFANGLDCSPVAAAGFRPPVKSIGNSTTAPHDLITDEEIKITLYVLCESVSARLREQNLICDTVQISVRNFLLQSYERQGKLTYPNRTAKALFEKAFMLYKQNHVSKTPVRSLAVRACNLSRSDYVQLSLLPEAAALARQEEAEQMADSIRRRFGHFAIRRGIFLTDRRLAELNPKDDHVIYPRGFL